MMLLNWLVGPKGKTCSCRFTVSRVGWGRRGSYPCRQARNDSNLGWALFDPVELFWARPDFSCRVEAIIPALTNALAQACFCRANHRCGSLNSMSVQYKDYYAILGVTRT